MLRNLFKKFGGGGGNKGAGQDPDFPSYVPGKAGSDGDARPVPATLPAAPGAPAATPIRHRHEALEHWLEHLPEGVRPSILIDAHPRIALRLAENWENAAKTQAYLEELMIDKRGDRAGFPVDVASEIMVLNNYYSNRFAPRDKFDTSLSEQADLWHKTQRTTTRK